MRTPVIIVNFKAYPEVEGTRAIALAEICQDVADETGMSFAVCPPVTEISSVAKAVTIPVMAQHLDPRKPGAATGWTTPELIKAAGAKGTLLNHSERRMVLADLALAIQMAKEKGLVCCVCTDTEATSAAAASLGPEFIAVEPPELIGGDVSVTDARPEIVSDAVAAVSRVDEGIKVLCGAGVKTGRDVAKAVELGASGVLLASGVVKAKEPRKVLLDLVQFL
jgi:triosephosphate isomerase (TIM)